MAKAADVQYSEQGAQNTGLIWEIQEEGTFETFVMEKFRSHLCLQASSWPGPKLYIFTGPHLSTRTAPGRGWGC